ncbi:MAG: YraN family protein [Candidatus Delongbacteria bacterium]|nr:YraN family protein [Candidatus Delongbacteria bacterium]MDD4205184.1 YraN family protein [Candidatus Delongbacteria bacterium]
MTTSKSDNKKTGDRGESIASQFLEDNGYRIIDRNFRYSTFGEIDIIAKKDGVLIFVEVKTYKTEEFGEPLLLVNHKKQQKIRKLAQIYMLQKHIDDIDCRFDVIGIKIAKADIADSSVTHIENAF